MSQLNPLNPPSTDTILIPCETVFEYPFQPYPQVPEAYEWPYGTPCYPTQQREQSYVGAPSHIDTVTGQRLRNHYRNDVVGMPPAMVIIPAGLMHSYSPTVPATFSSYSGNSGNDANQAHTQFVRLPGQKRHPQLNIK